MTLREQLQRGPYQAYAYSYPHKSAYRPLTPPVALADLWAQEARGALFGYLHVPFCGYRCGFCNLFALGRPEPALVARYVDQLCRQMEVVGGALGDHRFARFALGGGTPSHLSASQLEQLLLGINRWLAADLQQIPAGIELSPESTQAEQLRLCRSAGFDRASLGVQSLHQQELQALARPTSVKEIVTAIERIRAHDFPILNLDLIYGIPGQTVSSFLASLEQVLRFAPEEIYLYPLYVRPETGLGLRQVRRGEVGPDERRPLLYRAGRERLLAAGYRQVSMRMFRAAHAPAEEGPVYRCQEDGMVGLGCGARSYTQTLHYSDRYGVARASVAEILAAWVAAPVHHFGQAHHGFWLDGEEQRRRYLIQSLLVWPGLEEAAYLRRFGSAPLIDLPQLGELLELGLARYGEGWLTLTEAGMAQADIIGPWLASAAVVARMGADAAG